MGETRQLSEAEAAVTSPARLVLAGRACSPAAPMSALRAELLDLRERFEADKRRLADLRTMRKWKPY